MLPLILLPLAKRSILEFGIQISRSFQRPKEDNSKGEQEDNLLQPTEDTETPIESSFLYKKNKK